MKSRNQSCEIKYRFFEFYCRLQPITTHIAQLAMTSQILPQRAACALHLVYAIGCGAKFLLNSEEYIDSLSTIFVQSECDVNEDKFFQNENLFLSYLVHRSISISSWTSRWFNHVNISYRTNGK